MFLFPGGCYWRSRPAGTAGDEDKGDDDQEEEQEELGLAPERRATSTTSSTFHLTDASAVGPQGRRPSGLSKSDWKMQRSNTLFAIVYIYMYIYIYKYK